MISGLQAMGSAYKFSLAVNFPMIPIVAEVGPFAGGHLADPPPRLPPRGSNWATSSARRVRGFSPGPRRITGKFTVSIFIIRFPLQPHTVYTLYAGRRQPAGQAGSRIAGSGTTAGSMGRAAPVRLCRCHAQLPVLAGRSGICRAVAISAFA